ALEGLPRQTRMAKGTLAGPVLVHENGAVFGADLLGGQKTGWFFDQRDNRRFIAELARDARVFDLYCFTGGFAVQAARGGAASVTANRGTLFVACCSHNVGEAEFAEAVRRGLADAGRDGRILRTAGAGPDHPVHPALPETAYLKTMTLALD